MDIDATAGPAHLVPQQGPNGWARWMPPLAGARGDCTETLQLIESSLADGPHVALRHLRTGSMDRQVESVDEIIPLTAEVAWRLREQLDWLLEHHYQGDARPPSETLRPSPDATTTDLIVALSDEVVRNTQRNTQVTYAARRLLDNVDPFATALEVATDVDGTELYSDLALALGLPADYEPESDGS